MNNVQVTRKYSFHRLLLASIYLLGILGIVACGGGGGGGGGSGGDGSNESDTLTSANPTLSFELKTFLFTWADVSSASHYRLLENPDGFSGYSQISGDIPQGTRMFEHIVPLYMRVNASYILQACDSNGCIDSNSINVSDSLVNAIGYFKPDNTGRFDHFGGSVSLSDDGAILVVGANNRSGPRFLDSSLRSYFPRHQAASGKLMDS